MDKNYLQIELFLIKNGQFEITSEFQNKRLQYFFHIQ